MLLDEEKISLEYKENILKDRLKYLNDQVIVRPKGKFFTK